MSGTGDRDDDYKPPILTIPGEELRGRLLVWFWITIAVYFVSFVIGWYGTSIPRGVCKPPGSATDALRLPGYLLLFAGGSSVAGVLFARGERALFAASLVLLLVLGVILLYMDFSDLPYSCPAP